MPPPADEMSEPRYIGLLGEFDEAIDIYEGNADRLHQG
jgi:hypothetical protein